jgi:hypothetical protein
MPDIAFGQNVEKSRNSTFDPLPTQHDDLPPFRWPVLRMPRRASEYSLSP